jgi:hypothetical protein
MERQRRQFSAGALIGRWFMILLSVVLGSAICLDHGNRTEEFDLFMNQPALRPTSRREMTGPRTFSWACGSRRVRRDTIPTTPKPLGAGWTTAHRVAKTRSPRRLGQPATGRRGEPSSPFRR